MGLLKISSFATKIPTQIYSFILCEIFIGLVHKVQRTDLPPYLRLSFVGLDGLFAFLL